MAATDTTIKVPSPIHPIPIPLPVTGPTQQALQSGLGGAIGSDFLVAKSQLIFVEYSGNLSALTVAPATPAYKVLGTGYTNPEDVKLSVDGLHAYVTERSGDLVKVALTNANRSAATVIASGLNTPQQLFLDEAHNAAYVVEYATAGTLVKINLTTGAKTVLCSTLQNPVGVVLTSDLQFAYVTEQTTGPDQGRVSEVQIGTGGRTTIAKGLTAPFFLTWADAGQDSLYVPQRDPANIVSTVSIASGATTNVVSNVPFRPSSVAAPFAGQLYVCSNSEIELVTLAPVQTTDPLLLGIGYIPNTSINSATGLATTPAGSIYQVTDAPFGGLLPIMINFEAAANAGAAYYQVTVDATAAKPGIQTDAWTVYEWNGTEFAQITVSPAMVGTAQGCFPVHPVADLFNYQPQALGYELDSTALSPGLHTIQVQFLNSAGNKLTPNLVSEPMTIMVNNQPCVATLDNPTLNSTPANSCGILQYSNTSGLVTINYTASQPEDYATYSVTLVRGVTALGSPLILPSGASVPGSGPLLVSSPANTQPTVADLITGACPTAGFAAEIYTAATITNGNGRQSQYDASDLIAFVLAPSN